MHYHLEVIIPPTDDVQGAIEQILAPFSEYAKDEDGHETGIGFFDYFTISGRYSGEKLETALGREKIQAFREELSAMGVTVSAVQAGKPTLQPESQQGDVDRLWAKHFPDSGVIQCPLFDHGPDHIDTDICTLAKIPDGLAAARCIIAGPGYASGSLQAQWMVSESVWNGVTHERTAWDMTIKGAVDQYVERLSQSTDEYRAKHEPKPDWLCVTVDYHS